MYAPREALKDFLYTKLAILILALVVSGAVAVWGFQQAVEYGLISLSPVQSRGRIVQVEDQDRSVKVTFEYEDQKMMKRWGDLRQRKRFALRMNVGDDVSVLYFSAYPAIAQLEMQLSKQAISFYILLGCFFFHLAACTLILRTIRQIRQHTADDFYY